MKKILLLLLILPFVFNYTNAKNINVSNTISKDINTIFENSKTGNEVINEVSQYFTENKKNLTQTDSIYLKAVLIIERIGIEMNHQNFKNAFNFYSKLLHTKGKLDNRKLKLYSQILDYQSFSTVLQLITYFSSDEVDDSLNIKTFRFSYFPLEVNYAHNVASNLNWDFIGYDCSNLVEVSKTDKIDKYFCLIQNDQFAIEDIEKLEEYKNIQWLSDSINFLGYSIGFFPNKKEQIMELMKKYGLDIIKLDNSFINGYKSLLRYFDYKNDCKSFKDYHSKMKQNYLGDEIMKEKIFTQKYQNCNNN